MPLFAPFPIQQSRRRNPSRPTPPLRSPSLSPLAVQGLRSGCEYAATPSFVSSPPPSQAINPLATITPHLPGSKTATCLCRLSPSSTKCLQAVGMHTTTSPSLSNTQPSSQGTKCPLSRNSSCTCHPRPLPIRQLTALAITLCHRQQPHIPKSSFRTSLLEDAVHQAIMGIVIITITTDRGSRETMMHKS